MFLNRCAILGIRLYQVLLSPHLGRLGIICRHRPTCSQYGMLAYQKHGFLKATLLTWQRFWDCHPRSQRPFIDFP